MSLTPNEYDKGYNQGSTDALPVPRIVLLGDGTGVCIGGIGAVRLHQVVDQNGNVVAEFSNAGCNEIVYEDDGEGTGCHYDLQAIANANLIAAAPDLYAVVNALVDFKVPFDAEAHSIAAKAALAKARGEVK